MGLRAQYPAFMPEFKVMNTKTDIQLHNAVNGAVVLLRGLTVEDDGQGGFFQWDATSITAPDGVNVFAVTGVVTGRWLRMNVYAGSTGTVTSVATNNGTGITGGTITTTGTLAIDTGSVISTKANVNSKTITINAGSNITISQAATQNLGTPPVYTINATAPGTGTVTSVALAAPSIFSVSGSPVTTSGTLTFAPNNTTGDIIYGSGTNSLAYRAIGTTGQHLVVVGGLPVWRDTTAVPTSYVSSWSAGTTGFTPNTATTGAVTLAGVLVEANGGTHQSTYTTGDILYASASNTLSKLPIGTTAQHLVVVGGVPAWRDTAAAGTVYTFTNGLTLSGSNVRWKGTLLENTTITGAGFYSAFSGGRLEAGQGAAVTAANDLTLGADGNTFSITGATTINAITTANWQAGSVVNLIFASTPTVKNNTSGGAGTAKILLASSADFVAAANDVLTLLYDGTVWHETARKIAAAGGQFWPLTGTGTGIAATTIQYDIANGLEFRHTFTTAANNQYGTYQHSSITARATASDVFYGHLWRDTGVVTASSQIYYGLALLPVRTISAGSGTQFYALQVGGNITPSVDNNFQVGTVGLIGGGVFNSGAFTTTNTNTIVSLSNAAMTITGGGNDRINLFGSNGGFRFGHNQSNVDSGYNLQSVGEGKFEGGIVVDQLPTPSITTITNTLGGATTYKYKIVFKNKNGTTSAASAEATTTTGNATLDGTHFNTINWAITEAAREGVYQVLLYRTSGGATQGLITATTTSGNYIASSLNDVGAAADGTTAPAVNTTGNVSAGVLRPIAQLQSVGSFALGYVAKTASYTATGADYLIDFTSGTDTLTLPTAAGITGKMYSVVNSGSGTCKINTTSSQTFVNINTAPTILTLNAVGATAIVSYTVMSNGANWIVIAKVKDE